jgi:hypothetical protein
VSGGSAKIGEAKIPPRFVKKKKNGTLPCQNMEIAAQKDKNPKTKNPCTMHH